MTFEFETENYNTNRFINVDSSGSKLVDFLIKKGVVKDAKTANIMIIIISILFFALSIYFFVFGFDLPQGNPPVPAEPPFRPTSELEL